MWIISEYKVQKKPNFERIFLRTLLFLVKILYFRSNEKKILTILKLKYPYGI